MLRQFSTRRVLGFITFDWFGTISVLFLAAYLRVWIGNLPDFIFDATRMLGIPINTWEVNLASDALTPQVFAVVSLIWPFFFLVFHVYDGRYNETLKAELANVFLAVLAATLTFAGLLYFTYQETSRILFVMFFFLDMILLISVRVIWWALRHSKQINRTVHPVLIVGAGHLGQRVASELKRYGPAQIMVVGFVDDDRLKQNTVIKGLPVLGSLEEIPAIVQKHVIRDAVVALPLDAHIRMVDICRKLQGIGIRVHVVPDLFALSFPSATLYGFGDIPIIDLGQPGIYGWRRIFKRVFDVVVATIILMLAAPLMLITAALIKWDSPGPIFYRQRRMGENGQPFDMVKFRSMKVNADDKLHREHLARLIKENVSLAEGVNGKADSLKLQNDPRITRVGRFIRKTSIDELPQLLNVLQGEMSLVGPRPPIPYEVDMYQEWHKRRLEAIPGMTGLWQVHGRNQVSFDEMVQMDITYIEQQSLWLDFKLLLLTPFALLSSRGAG
ncbi:MAG: sugar transferase [Caldilineaceae bacterium]|nr:sugar transferase [Caldilineaceae bacterium]